MRTIGNPILFMCARNMSISVDYTWKTNADDVTFGEENRTIYYIGECYVYL